LLAAPQNGEAILSCWCGAPQKTSVGAPVGYTAQKRVKSP